MSSVLEDVNIDELDWADRPKSQHVQKMSKQDKGFLTKEECQFIISLWDDNRREIYTAEVSNGVQKGTRYNNQRKGKIKWVATTHIPFWSKIRDRLLETNDNVLNNYALNGNYQIQLARYEIGDHFKKHKDESMSVTKKMSQREWRKLSTTIQLSDPDDYEGGKLILVTDYNPDGGSYGIKTPIDQGTMITFPSYVEHSVEPVTKGVRYSLVIWTMGPWFK